MKRNMQVTGLTALLILSGSAAWADKATTIWFVEDYANPGKCLASTVTKKQPAKRNEKLTWRLKNDPDNKCPGFDPTKAYLLFDDDVVGKNHKIDGKGNGTATATTSSDPKEAPDGLHHYKVYYNSTLAEDPELDIKGDMPPITPKGRGRGATPPAKKK